ncbi:MAG: putative baseplate assembly protein [Ilumatobacteraceae bacterium]
MSLPVPNLDDRHFQDIVDEAKRLIPTYCPEWTNHNVSDPGVALIELFAWMTEMTLFRLNQVPDVFFTHMLNLIGFEPFPASAARTDITFWLSGATSEPVVIPEGTEVATAGEVGEPRVFTTLSDLVITQPELIAALSSAEPDVYVDVWDDLRIEQGAVTCFPADPLEPGGTFYLGFDRALAGNALQLTIRANVEGIGVLPDRPPLVWEVWEGEGWIPTRVFSDSTGGLNRDGTIVLLVPNAHEALRLGTTRAHWLRARLLPPEQGQPFYRASPQLRTVAVASVGGTIVAEHSEAVVNEVLGVSSGRPDQRFELDHAPILDRSEGETILVVTDLGAEEWSEVSDFVASGPGDRHFVWSSSTGAVAFGPNIRYADGSTRQHGAVPPEGARIVAGRYRHGGGAAGNVGAGTLTLLRSSIPYITRVDNVDPAIGGVDAETIDGAKRRAPQTLRAGARAVTAEDFERLAAEADPSVARVRCLPPEASGRPVRLLVVPSVKSALEDQKLDDFALSPALLQRLGHHLDQRRILGSTVEIATPYYQGVTIAAMVTARPGRPAGLVRDRARRAIYRYVSPLNGGPDGNGWPFDADLSAANVFQVLEAVEGVERVEEVLLFEYDLRNGERIGYGREVINLERDSLFLSAFNRVVVR